HRVVAGRQVIEGDAAAVRRDVLTRAAGAAHGDGVAVGIGGATRRADRDVEAAGERRWGRAVDGERGGGRAARRDRDGLGGPAAHAAVAREAAQGHRVVAGRQVIEGDAAAVRRDVLTRAAGAAHGDGVAVGILGATRRADRDVEAAGERGRGRTIDGERGGGRAARRDRDGLG